MLDGRNVLTRGIPHLVMGMGLAAWMSVAAQAQQPADGPKAVVLVKTFADGRITRTVVSARKTGSWTPFFPRLKSWTPPPGKAPISALRVSHVLTEQGVLVQVSILRGSPHQEEEQVESVTVRADQPTVVERLRDFGLEPVTFSLIPLDATTLVPPRVDNQTAGLSVENIEMVLDPDPRYRVTVRNLTQKPAIMFFVKTFVADQLTSSGRQGNQDGNALIGPGDAFEFLVSGSSRSNPTASGWSPGSLDAIELAAVLWDDGTFEGEPEHVATSLLLYVGRRAQLRRVVDIMNAAMDPADAVKTITRLRTQFEALPVRVDATTREAALERLKMVLSTPPADYEQIIEAALASVRTGALRDVGDAPTSSPAFSQWHREMVAQYNTARANLARR